MSATVPVALEGAHRKLALMVADLQQMRVERLDRTRELQIAQSHLLCALGEAIYQHGERERRVQRRTIYVVMDGSRVVTLCYRRHNDPASLQIAYDSALETA